MGRNGLNSLILLFFECIIGIKNDNRKKALLLHPAGTDTQDILKTLTHINSTYKTALE